MNEVQKAKLTGAIKDLKAMDNKSIEDCIKLLMKAVLKVIEYLIDRDK